MCGHVRVCSGVDPIHCPSSCFEILEWKGRVDCSISVPSEPLVRWGQQTWSTSCFSSVFISCLFRFLSVIVLHIGGLYFSLLKVLCYESSLEVPHLASYHHFPWAFAVSQVLTLFHFSQCTSVGSTHTSGENWENESWRGCRRKLAYFSASSHYLPFQCWPLVTGMYGIHFYITQLLQSLVLSGDTAMHWELWLWR